jgi:hypothetical protein
VTAAGRSRVSRIPVFMRDRTPARSPECCASSLCTGAALQIPTFLFSDKPLGIPVVAWPNWQRKAMDPRHNSETTALLQNATNDPNTEHHTSLPPKNAVAPEYFLPIAFIAAVAMASTSVTSYYAYATILCSDPRHCEGAETSRYASLVAISTCIANMLGMSALGYLQKLVISNQKRGLLLWMLCRSMSAVMLFVGGK